MMNETGDVSLQPTSHPDVFHRYRDVILSKGRDGYGFVLRGAKGKSVKIWMIHMKKCFGRYIEHMPLMDESCFDGRFVLMIFDTSCQVFAVFFLSETKAWFASIHQQHQKNNFVCSFDYKPSSKNIKIEVNKFDLYRTPTAFYTRNHCSAVR